MQCFNLMHSAGGPNSNDFAANHTIHHTIGLPDLGEQYRAFKEFTCAAVVVQHISEAHHQIDYAISEALVSSAGAGDWLVAVVVGVILF